MTPPTPPWICPSILAADFARLGDEVSNVLAAGADTIHFDVMDNHYVPNLSVGPLVLSALRKAGIDACVDVHLMVKPVDRLVEEFLLAGADYITVHPESTEHLHRTPLHDSRRRCQGWIGFNPATPLEALEPVIEMIDLVLIMSVNPGFGVKPLSPQALKSCARRAALSTPVVEIFACKLMAVLKSTTLAQLPRQGQMLLWRVLRYSAQTTMQPR